MVSRGHVGLGAERGFPVGQENEGNTSAYASTQQVSWRNDDDDDDDDVQLEISHPLPPCSCGFTPAEGK